MAFQLASAYVQLGQRGFGSVMGGINAIGERLTRLVNPATLVSTAIGAIGSSLTLGKMVGMAAEAEALETQLTTLTGSAENARDMMAQLRDFGAKTPFELPGLAQTTKTLLAFGVSQEQVIPTLRVIGDIASATGKPLGELGDLYGKIKSQGKLSMETVMQLQERAIPIVDTLAKQYGKSSAEIQKMVSAGKIGFGDVQRAMVEMTSAGGMFAGGMERQAGTFQGVMSTLKDSIGATMTDIGTAILEGFDLTGGVQQLTGLIDTFKGWVVPTITQGIQTIREYFAGFGPYIESVRNLLEAIGGTGSSAFGILGDAAAWYFGLIQKFYNYVGAPIINTFAEIVGNSDLYWQLIGLHVGNFAINAWERIKTFGINVVEIVAWAARNWREIFIDLGNGLVTIFSNIGENLKSLWNAVVDFIAGRGFQVDFKPLMDGFTSAIEEMPELTKANLNQLKPEIERAYAELNRRHKQVEEERQQQRIETGKPGGPADGDKDLAIDDSGTKGVRSGKDKAQFVGLAQLAEKMQTAAGETQDRKRMIDLQARSVQVNEQLLQKATGEGIRVAANVASMPPTVSYGFGEQ